MDMQVPYELTGRTRQKARTRAALIAGARDLLSRGVDPTVEEAAEEAGISRTTAYRYFPNQRALLEATYPEIDQATLLPPEPPTDLGERLDLLLDRLIQVLLDYEPELRTMLRLSLESNGPEGEELVLRRGRVIGWLEDALAPGRERIDEQSFRRLVLAIRTTVGIEALVWLTDVAGASRDDASEVMRWAAHALLRSALADDASA